MFYPYYVLSTAVLNDKDHQQGEDCEWCYFKDPHFDYMHCHCDHCF